MAEHESGIEHQLIAQMPSPSSIGGDTINCTTPNQRGMHYYPHDKAMNSGANDNSVLSSSSDSNSFLRVLPNTAGNHIDSLGLGREEANVDLTTEPIHGTSSSTVTSTKNEFTKENILIAEDTLKTFSAGTIYDTIDDLISTAKIIGNSKLFTVRKTGRNMVVCSRARN